MRSPAAPPEGPSPRSIDPLRTRWILARSALPPLYRPASTAGPERTRADGPALYFRGAGENMGGSARAARAELIPIPPQAPSP